MAEQGMKFVVGADVSQANNAIKILTAQFERLQKLAALPNLSFKQQERLNAMLARTAKELDFTKKSAENLAKSLGNVKPGANQATTALTNFSRVVQDAPFGIIGIANNIDPLIQSFQSLRRETGSSGAAFKALGSSLMGGGGIALGVSVITSLLVAFGDKLFGSTKKVEENKDAIQASTTEYEKYLEKLKEVTATMSSEAAKVTILFGALGDTNLKLGERKSIISQLNSISGRYLGHLDAEKASYVEISRAVEDYLKNVATATELKALLPEFEKMIQKMVGFQIELNQIRRQRGISKGLGLFSDEDEKEFTEQEAQLLHRINAIGRELKHAKGVLNDIAGGPLALQELLFGKPDQQAKEVKEAKDTLEEELKELFRTSTLIAPTGQQTILHRMMHGILDEWDTFIDKLKAPKDAHLPIKEVIVTPIDEAAAALKEKIKKLEEQANALLGNLAISGLEGVGEALGAVLGGEGLGKAVAQMGNLLGSALQTIGKFAIQAGIEMLAIKKALTALFDNPLLLIAAGVAAVAIGAAIKARIPKFAEGGIVTKPTLGLFGEAGPEAVIPLNKMNGIGGGVEVFGKFEIDGKKLVAVLARTERSLNRST